MTTEAPLSGGDARTQLAEAMSVQHGCDTLLSTSGKPCNRCTQSARALLPVVERIADERAAEALEEFAAKWWVWVMEDAPQIRGGAAYRARAEAASLRAASRGETGCYVCNGSGVVEDHDGDRPCLSCRVSSGGAEQ